MRKCEHILAALAILGSFIGGIGLICLAAFDTKRHTSLHRVFLLVFIFGVGISAIFTVSEVRSPLALQRLRSNSNLIFSGCAPQYKWLSRDFPDIEKLQRAYIAKTIIVTAIIALGVAFGITMFTDVDTGGQSNKSRPHDYYRLIYSSPSRARMGRRRYIFLLPTHFLVRSPSIQGDGFRARES